MDHRNRVNRVSDHRDSDHRDRVNRDSEHRDRVNRDSEHRDRVEPVVVVLEVRGLLSTETAQELVRAPPDLVRDPVLEAPDLVRKPDLEAPDREVRDLVRAVLVAPDLVRGLVVVAAVHRSSS